MEGNTGKNQMFQKNRGKLYFSMGFFAAAVIGLAGFIVGYLLTSGEKEIVIVPVRGIAQNQDKAAQPEKADMPATDTHELTPPAGKPTEKKEVVEEQPPQNSKPDKESMPLDALLKKIEALKQSKRRVTYKLPSLKYTDQELAALREWEKIWAEKKIDKSNIDRVAQFLPPSFAGLYKNPEQWGAPAEGLYFYITQYQTYTPTRGELEATIKYAPSVEVRQDGSIANCAQISGIPFPAPGNGLEIAHDFDFNSHGDGAHYRRFCPNINPVSRHERVAEVEIWELFFVNRTEIAPLPAFDADQNRKGFRRGMFQQMHSPPEFKDTRMFTMRYIDASKDDDTYMWYAQFRRIRRMSTAQRTDSIDGTDLIYDDEYFWDGQILRNTYSYTGTKELLCSRHQDMRKTTRGSGQAVVNGLTLERCKTLVVDAASKDPNYPYSKRVWYVDPASYLVLWTEIYDAKGRFWKCFMQNADVLKTATGEKKHFIVGSQFVDFQKKHAGLSDQQSHYYSPEISINVAPDMFSVGNLQKTY